MKSLFIWVLIGVLEPIYCLAQETTPETKPPLVVEEVRCQGNNSTSCQFIAGHLYLSSGDQLNEEEIQNAKLRLSSLPNFKSVDTHLEKGAEKGRAVVVIEVTEASPITKEIAIGTSLRNSSLSQKLAGRVSHQNLFGTGKILDLEVGGRIPVNEPTRRDVSTRLQFVDPNLFGSKKYFFISGLSYQNSLYTYKDGDSYASEQLGVDASLGRRIWDFSYITAGYQFRPTSNITDRYTLSDGTHETKYDSYDRVYLLGYGWNSEDDPYFPTQGSRFNTSFAWSSSDHYSTLLKVGIAYRTTWNTANNSIWTFKVGGTPGTEHRPTLDEDLGISLAYARPIAASDKFGGIERGRWYVEPGFQGLGFSSYSGTILDPGIKAGVRLETKALGIVDLYAIGSTEWRVGGNK